MGSVPLLLGGDAAVLADPQGRKWSEMIRSGEEAEAAVDIIVSFGKGAISKAPSSAPAGSASTR
jgi:hypothetical protein